MNYKKYVLFLLLTLVLGFNKIYAEECYYISDNFSARYNPTTHNVYVDKSGSNLDYFGDNEDILNLNESVFVGGWKMPAYTDTNKCPNYLIIDHDECACCLFCAFDTYDIYATDNEEDAKKIVDLIKLSDHNGFYSTMQPNMKEEEYIKNRYEYTETLPTTNNKNEEEDKLKCDPLFGDINDAGSFHYDEITKKKVVDRPASIRYLVNQVLTYVRIIVPIIILVLGSIDLAKAMVAGKEDEMKKAQKTFIMRLVAGVLVFMAPMIVNLIMSLAEIVWEGLGYDNCGLQ